MNQRLLEVLSLPDAQTLRAGAVALLAAIAIGPLPASEEPNQIRIPITPKVLEIDDVEAASAVYEPVTSTPPQINQTEEGQHTGTPAIIDKFIDRNTVRLEIGQLSCSGSLIRGHEGEPLGALTAAHCLTGMDAKARNPLLRGGDNNAYILPSGPIKLGRGEKATDLEAVGEVQSFVVPALTSNADQAFVVLDDHTPREVLEAYQRRALTPSQARELNPNQNTIWLAGYPFTQDGDGAGSMVRQELATKYIGKDVSLVFGGFQNVLSATVDTNSNGALCSWGISGGEGLVVQTRRSSGGDSRQVVRSIGNVSSFAPLHPIQQKSGDSSVSRQEARYNRITTHQTFPEASLRGVDAVCNYSYMPLRKHIVVYPVADEGSIPGPVKEL